MGTEWVFLWPGQGGVRTKEEEVHVKEEEVCAKDGEVRAKEAEVCSMKD